MLTWLAMGHKSAAIVSDNEITVLGVYRNWQYSFYCAAKIIKAMGYYEVGVVSNKTCLFLLLPLRRN